MNARHFLPIASLVFALGAPVAARVPATYPALADVVIRASDLSQAAMHGAWTLAADASASDGIKLAAWYTDPEVVPLVETPQAAPADYIDVTFAANAGTPYRVWLRLNGAVQGRDSVWLQFSDAQVDGGPAYAIDTPTGLLVTMHPCPGCVTSGWGWQDSSWTLRQPSTVRFAAGGLHTLRLQPRVPGVQIDQIVLSPQTYLDRAPGAPQEDLTVLSRQR